jgi:hypothetical protein
MNIIAIKLVTGEEILGEEIDSEVIDGCITLKNPVGIAVVRGQDGQPNIGFTPFPLHAEQKSGTEISIPIAHVVYEYEPAEDFKTNYDQIFGTGIIKPTKQIITG